MSSDDELLGSIEDLEEAGVTQPVPKKGGARGLIDDEADISGDADEERIEPEKPEEFDSFIDNRPLPPDRILPKRGEKRQREEGAASDLSGSDDEDLNELGDEDREVIGSHARASTGKKHRRLKKKGRTEDQAENLGARERVAASLFGNDDFEDVEIDEPEAAPAPAAEDIEEDFSDEEELGQFIVDENGIMLFYSIFSPSVRVLRGRWPFREGCSSFPRRLISPCFFFISPYLPL